jgi:hypothetical protein
MQRQPFGDQFFERRRQRITRYAKARADGKRQQEWFANAKKKERNKIRSKTFAGIALAWYFLAMYWIGK